MNPILKSFSLVCAICLPSLLPNVGRAEMIYSNDFTTSSLGSPEWSTTYASVSGRGITQIRPQPDLSGSKALSMQIKGGSTAINNLNSIDLSIDLSQHSDVELSFDHYVFEDMPDSFGALASFTGQANFDGISISSDSTNWFPIWTPTSVSTSAGVGLWTMGEMLNISSAIATIGSPNLVSGATGFKIRFQQYGSFDVGSMNSDGRAFDNILVSGNRLPPPPVPEPTTAALLGIGAVCSVLANSRRRRRVK